MHELCAVRLVSRDWELASRSFFASKYISRPICWLTSSGLWELEQIPPRFWPHIQTIYVASTCFTLFGLRSMFMQHLHDKRTFIKSRNRTNRVSGSLLAIKALHLGRVFTHYGWRHLNGRLQTMNFFWYYLRNIFWQRWLRISGSDVARLANVLEKMPNCNIEVVDVGYGVGDLFANDRNYGKPAPAYAFELALYSSSEQGHVDPGYTTHLVRVVEEAKRRRKQLLEKLKMIG